MELHMTTVEKDFYTVRVQHTQASAIIGVQEIKRQVQEALQNQGNEQQGYFSAVTNAVSSAGSAIGQLGNQILGGGDVSMQ